MSKPKVAVISGFGINCELETMAAFEMAGASADRVLSLIHISEPTRP